MAEGYQVGEIAQFQADVDEFIDHLFNTPPFDEDDLACAFNVYRLEVVSDESGVAETDIEISVVTLANLIEGRPVALLIVKMDEAIP
ncbi:MAG: M64 family metallopeptidase [Candidatus Thiodiazotropha sp. (ex Dulcina madagascariensis)]|nr:M64 family metallopeptidase [Candidatus Thiodiazotropha sp. (ex Dulcina madagascariensis)]MCU7925168.1 M64 family metallopeptidase [Candidatus Thiodiazotropha sp. (ex Dulcina madagascariensis)]